MVEQSETETAAAPKPLIWPWLLALLVLVLGGLGALYFFTQDDDEPAATTTSAATTSAETLPVPDVVGTTSSEATATLRDAGFEVNVVPCRRTGRAGRSSPRIPPPAATRRTARPCG